MTIIRTGGRYIYDDGSYKFLLECVSGNNFTVLTVYRPECTAWKRGDKITISVYLTYLPGQDKPKE
jgi:hypothetical protein